MEEKRNAKNVAQEATTTDQNRSTVVLSGVVCLCNSIGPTIQRHRRPLAALQGPSVRRLSIRVWINGTWGRAIGKKRSVG